MNKLIIGNKKIEYKEIIYHYSVPLYLTIQPYYQNESFSICGKIFSDFISEKSKREFEDMSYFYHDFFATAHGATKDECQDMIRNLFGGMCAIHDHPKLINYLIKFKQPENFKSVWNKARNEILSDDLQAFGFVLLNTNRIVKLFNQLLLDYSKLTIHKYRTIQRKVYRNIFPLICNVNSPIEQINTNLL